MIAFMSDAYEEAKQVAKARWCFSEFVQLEDHIASLHHGHGWRIDEFILPDTDNEETVRGGMGGAAAGGAAGGGGGPVS